MIDDCVTNWPQLQHVCLWRGGCSPVGPESLEMPPVKLSGVDFGFQIVFQPTLTYLYSGAKGGEFFAPILSSTPHH